MDVLYVSCDIVANCSVASREGSEEFAVAVCQADGCTVEFELAAEGECVADSFFRSLCKGFHFSDVVGVAEG